MLKGSSLCRGAIREYPHSAQFDGKKFRNVQPRHSLSFGDYRKMLWDFLFNKPKDTQPPAALPVRPITLLRPYQQTGVDWLQMRARSSSGGVLADDMGLPTTVQMLAHPSIA